MSESDFKITSFPYEEGNEAPEEIKNIDRWRFSCDRPIDGENSESSFMLSWDIKSEDNRYSYKGEIREGYIYQDLSTEQGVPSLDKTMHFVRTQMISKESFNENCIFVPYNSRIGSNLLEVLNSNSSASLLLRLLSRTGGINLGSQGSLSSILNQSFLEELERAKNEKKPTSKEALDKLEILTADENLLKKYMEEDTSIKDKAKIEIEKEGNKENITDEDIYKKVLQNWRDSQSNGIRCAMCLEFVKINEKVVRLPCKNKEGKPTPHYFHYIESDEEGNPKTDNCVGCGVMEWLKEQNTCPCCRFELPIEKEIKNDKKDAGNSDNSSNEEVVPDSSSNEEVAPDSSSNTEEIPENVGSSEQIDLLRSILGIVANNPSQTTSNEPCQCPRCVEIRRENERLENMSEQERIEEQLLREALRRSGNNSEMNENVNRTHEGIDGEMMTEEEAIEAAIRASLND